MKRAFACDLRQLYRSAVNLILILALSKRENFTYV